MELEEAERIEDAVGELREIRHAQRVAAAFHEPKRLWSEAERVRAALTDPTGGDREQFLKRVAEIDAAVRRWHGPTLVS